MTDATTPVALGATTTNKKWYADVNTGTYAAPIWLGIFGVTDCKPSITQTTQDDGDFQSDGWGSDNVTELKWALELKVRRGVTAANPVAYDPGQEALRLAGGQTGLNNKVDVRWYEMEPGGPRVEAYRGFASVSYSDDGGDRAANSTASITLSGKGKRTSITHPDSVPTPAPAITALVPATGPAAGGTLVQIQGSHFTGMTAVTFDGTAATNKVVISDTLIVATAPAHTAATTDVAVTTPAGTSANTAADNFIYT